MLHYTAYTLVYRGWAVWVSRAVTLQKKKTRRYGNIMLDYTAYTLVYRGGGAWVSRAVTLQRKKRRCGNVYLPVVVLSVCKVCYVYEGYVGIAVVLYT